MVVGDNLTLKAEVTPDYATDKTVTWETSDANVATVKNGVVTAVGAGAVVITAKAGDKTAQCAIVVELPAGIDGVESNVEYVVYDLKGNKVLDKENIEGVLEIIEVQPESKKRMAAQVFINGRGVQVGDVLGKE